MHMHTDGKFCECLLKVCPVSAEAFYAVDQHVTWESPSQTTHSSQCLANADEEMDTNSSSSSQVCSQPHFDLSTVKHA